MSIYETSITNPKKQLEFYKQLSEHLQQENRQLKEKLDCDLQWAFKYEKQVDNWNKLKEYITEANEDLYWTNTYDDILYVMQELEKVESDNQ